MERIYVMISLLFIPVNNFLCFKKFYSTRILGVFFTKNVDYGKYYVMTNYIFLVGLSYQILIQKSIFINFILIKIYHRYIKDI